MLVPRHYICHSTSANSQPCFSLSIKTLGHVNVFNGESVQALFMNDWANLHVHV